MSERESSDEMNQLAPAASSEVESWEDVLARAERFREGTPGEGSYRPPQASRAALILKASLPFLVIALYFLFKFGAIPGGGYRSPGMLPPPPDSLSGLADDETAVERLTDRQKSLINRLESMRRANRWPDIISTANSEANKSIASHPVIQALVLIARTKNGERSIELENDMIGTEAELTPSAKEYVDLLFELRLARVRLMLARISSPDLLIHNIETFRQLLGEEPRNTDDLMVRIRLAQRFEDAGDLLMEQGDGYLSDDLVLIRQGRSFYQMGLRWIIRSGRWYQLEPISQAAVPEIERLVQKMRVANREIHGPSLPLTDNDSTTWSGKRGDPVHDLPEVGR